MKKDQVRVLLGIGLVSLKPSKILKKSNKCRNKVDETKATKSKVLSHRSFASLLQSSSFPPLLLYHHLYLLPLLLQWKPRRARLSWWEGTLKNGSRSCLNKMNAEIIINSGGHENRLSQNRSELSRMITSSR